MIFLSLVTVLAIVFWLGNANFLHMDGWFKWLVKRFQSISLLSAVPALPLILALAIPLLLLVVLFIAVSQFLPSPWLGLFIVYVVVLLYSLGRGNMVDDIKNYIALSVKGDSVAAALLLDKLRGNSNIPAVSGEDADWRSLHAETLNLVAYIGFERTFAVLFWFFIAGPFGALLYRMSVMYRDFSPADSDHARTASHWLWLIEFPAVRLMGLTWAFVGNFETSPLRKNLLDSASSSEHVLNECLRGALGASTISSVERLEHLSEEEQTEHRAEMDAEAQDILQDLTGDVVTTHSEPAYSFALVKSSIPLYNRSLLFWVCAIAFATLIV